MDTPPRRSELHDADTESVLSRRRATSTSYRSGTPSPVETPLLSSPSLASSLNGQSPLRHEVPPDDASSVRSGLARRLSQLAQQLSDGQEEVDEPAINTEVDRLEKALASPPTFKQHRRPMSLDMRSRTDLGMGAAGISSTLSSPAPSLFRSRFSELSLSWLRERERERERDAEEERQQEREKEDAMKQALALRQARKIIAETTKLNEEMTQVVNNMKARQEESEHIHSLLIERAERAAQRIIFLQNRISYLEEELHENDDELQHLRISLKAVEISMPPHPDQELQRCFSSFKRDYLEAKRKRANRSSIASVASYESSLADSTVQSPAR